MNICIYHIQYFITFYCKDACHSITLYAMEFRNDDLNTDNKCETFRSIYNICSHCSGILLKIPT